MGTSSLRELLAILYGIFSAASFALVQDYARELEMLYTGIAKYLKVFYQSL